MAWPLPWEPPKIFEILGTIRDRKYGGRFLGCQRPGCRASSNSKENITSEPKTPFCPLRGPRFVAAWPLLTCPVQEVARHLLFPALQFSGARITIQVNKRDLIVSLRPVDALPQFLQSACKFFLARWFVAPTLLVPRMLCSISDSPHLI